MIFQVDGWNVFIDLEWMALLLTVIRRVGPGSSSMRTSDRSGYRVSSLCRPSAAWRGRSSAPVDYNFAIISVERYVVVFDFHRLLV